MQPPAQGRIWTSLFLPISDQRFDAASVAPNRLRVFEDLFRGEPEPLHFLSAVQFRLVIVMRRRTVLGLPVWKKSPDLLRLTLNHNEEMSPTIIAVDLAIVLRDALVRMKDAVHIVSTQRKRAPA